MSDSSTSNDRSAENALRSSPPGGPPSLLRWLLVINTLVGVVLIALWLTFGQRGGSFNSKDPDSTSSTAGRPFARAIDAVDDEELGDGKPKVVKIDLKWPASGVADFALTDRSGKTVTKADLQGHPWVVSFIFTNCAGPCFKVTSAMKRLQDEFLDTTDLRFVTLTVDPERDTPAKLTKYANDFQADPERWLFLTDLSGKKDKIYPLIWGSFLQRVEEAEGEMREPGFEFIHTNNILLVDEQGIVQGKWLSTDEAEFDQLRRELKKRYLHTKAAGSPSSQVDTVQPD